MTRRYGARPTGLLACACMYSALVAPVAHGQRSADERGIEEPWSEPLARSLGTPEVAFAGEQFLVVWIEQRLVSDAQPITQLFAARVTPGGRVLDPRGIAIASAGALRREPRVVASGDGFVVLWRESRNASSEGARFARVDADGNVLDPEGTPLPFYAAELGCAGPSCLTASTPTFDPRVLAFDVCGVHGEESSLVVPPRTSSQSNATSGAPRIVSNGCGHVLALGQHDERSGEVSIALAGFELDGRSRFARSVQSVHTGGPTLPAFDLAANGDGELLLIWQQAANADDAAAGAAATDLPAQLWSLWCDRDGKTVSPPKHVADGKAPALAFNGDGYVLITGDDTLAAQMLDAHGAVISARPTPFRSEPSGLRTHTRVAAGEAGALVVWQPASTPLYGERNAARLDPDGSSLDPDGFTIAAAANRQWGPHLVRDGEDYLLLFRDDRPDGAGLRVLRLDAQGTPIGSAARVVDDRLDGLLDARRDVALVAAGKQFALVFADDQSALVSWFDPATLRAETPGRPLAADGASLAQAPLVPGDGSILALVSGPGLLCGEDQECDATLSLVLLAADGRADAGTAAPRFGPDGEWARSEALGAYDGRGFVVAFTQARVEAAARDASIRVVHVEPDGSVAREPLIVTRAAQDVVEHAVAIASADDGYLLVLARTSAASIPRHADLFGLRLDRELSPLDAEPFALTSSDADRVHVSASHDGQAWLVAWQERVDNASWDIRAARVPADPGSAPALFAVAVSPRDELNPTLAAASADRALIAYERFDDDPASMTGRIFLQDLLADARCDDPDCCDGECSPPPAPRCELPPEQTCGAEPAIVAHHRRYGCGCRMNDRSSAGHGAFVFALLALAWLMRSASLRSRRQQQ